MQPKKVVKDECEAKKCEGEEALPELAVSYSSHCDSSRAARAWCKRRMVSAKDNDN